MHKRAACEKSLNLVLDIQIHVCFFLLLFPLHSQLFCSLDYLKKKKKKKKLKFHEDIYFFSKSLPILKKKNDWRVVFDGSVEVPWCNEFKTTLFNMRFGKNKGGRTFSKFFHISSKTAHYDRILEAQMKRLDKLSSMPENLLFSIFFLYSKNW